MWIHDIYTIGFELFQSGNNLALGLHEITERRPFRRWLVALLSTFATQWVKDHLAQSHMRAAITAFVAAFAVYEGSLFAISLMFASGGQDYAPAIVWRVFAINTAAFAALFLVHRLGVFAGLAKEPPQPHVAAPERRA